MTRMSTPCSSRWVAKLCRNVWTVTDLLSPAASAARRQASCNARLVIGRAGLRPAPAHRQQTTKQLPKAKAQERAKAAADAAAKAAEAPPAS